MDIKCPKCGEPWDNDSIHEEVNRRNQDQPSKYHVTYAIVAKEFRQNGCAALDVNCSDNIADPRIALAYDVLGDDMDGAAAIMEDLIDE